MDGRPVLVGLGSNLGDRAAHIARAMEDLERLPGVMSAARSAVYETEPVGGPPDLLFLNAVVRLEAAVPAADLLRAFLSLEAAAGRVRTVRNAPRPLDLDLLLCGSEVIAAPGLRVPHPRLHDRAFVLVPACDVAPGLVHPLIGRTLSEILSGLRDTGGVRRIEMKGWP